MTAQGLSKRELECVTLAARGYSDDQIGHELNIAGKTVSAHLQKAYVKLGVHSRQLAAEKLGIGYLGARMPMANPPLAPSGQGAPANGDLLSTDGATTSTPWLLAPYRGMRRTPPRLLGSLLPVILGWTVLGLVILAVLVGLLNAVFGSGDPFARRVDATADQGYRHGSQTTSATGDPPR